MMAANKRYAPPQEYEKKLERVMERLGIENYNYDFSRHAAWVEFRYKGSLYRFDHSVEKAQERGINLTYGSDAFAQIVLSLEDLARMVERGIYDLQTWVSGMKYLPQAVEIPSFFKYMGFKEIPKSEEEVKQKFRELSKIMHPDVGGSPEDFHKLNEAYGQALAYVGIKEGGKSVEKHKN